MFDQFVRLALKGLIKYSHANVKRLLLMISRLSRAQMIKLTGNKIHRTCLEILEGSMELI